MGGCSIDHSHTATTPHAVALPCTLSCKVFTPSSCQSGALGTLPRWLCLWDSVLWCKIFFFFFYHGTPSQNPFFYLLTVFINLSIHLLRITSCIIHILVLRYIISFAIRLPNEYSSWVWPLVVLLFHWTKDTKAFKRRGEGTRSLQVTNIASAVIT